MARSRNIKPGFFTNDVLGELPALTRLLFAGLWTICDREGRIEDRPKKIRAEVLPYDECDPDAMLQSLHDGGFIERYEVEGRRLIQVCAWAEHQNPHVKEAASTLPAPCKSGASPVQAPDEAQPLPALAGLIPSSLIPDSLVPPSGEKPSRRKAKTQLPEDFAPNETGARLCAAGGFTLSDELLKFRNYHQAAGTLMADWQAGFRTWIDKAKSFRKPWQTPLLQTATTPTPATAGDALEKIKADAARATAPPAEVRQRMAELTGKVH